MVDIQIEENKDYIFEFRTVQSGAFRILIEALKEILTDANFQIDSTGIKLMAMDPTHTILVHLKLHAEHFEYYKCNKKSKEFIEKIKKVENFIVEKYDKVLENKSFTPSIKFSKSNEDAFFNVNIQIFNNKLVLPVFNYKKEQKSHGYILPRSRTLNIVYLKDMWRVNKRVGFNWILLQTKVYLPFLYINKCLIVDEPENQCANKLPGKNNEPNIFEKYIRMQKFGVPEVAIKIELEKNNLSFDDFMNYNPQKNTNKVSLIKKPMINISMLQGVKLKNSKRKRKKISKPKKGMLVNMDTKNYRPPTKELLADLIKNLRKQSPEMPLL